MSEIAEQFINRNYSVNSSDNDNDLWQWFVNDVLILRAVELTVCITYGKKHTSNV